MSPGDSTKGAAGLDGNAAYMLGGAEDDATAVVERSGPTTYGSLRARVGGIAAALADVDVGPGDRVAILARRGADASAAFFGTLAAGAIAVNVNETLRPRQIEHILDHAGARALLTTGEMLGRQPRPIKTGATVLLLDERPWSGGFQPVPRIGVDPAQIIYTSGSTGLPKGVTVSHANLWAGTRAVVAYVGIVATDRIAGLLPFSFDYGLSQLLCAMYAGATLVVEDSPIPASIATALVDHAVTVLACVPPLWLQLLQTSAFRGELPALRAMTNTGGRLPVEAVRDLRRLHPGADVHLMYGLTEAFRGTSLPPGEVDARPDSIGRAIPGCEILVVDDEGHPCGPDEIGELVQRGATVTLGYWNDPAATDRVYRPPPSAPPGAPTTERAVWSGDLVRRDEDDFLYFVGRRDRMIKSLGFRVSPDEVVDVLHASGEVAEAMVTSEEDPRRGERIVAWIVLTPAGSLERLERFCRIELPRYMQPARFEVRDLLPRTASGKFAVAVDDGGDR